MSDLKDWRGTPIEVGCTVIWAVAHSSSITMNEGVVVAIGEKPGQYSWPLRDVPFVRVRWVKDHHTRTYQRQRDESELTALDRVTVLVPAPEAN